MKMDWGNVPIELPCPKCQVKIENFIDLKEAEWKYIIPRNPEPLKDYHKCPHCQRMWAILKPHTDQV